MWNTACSDYKITNAPFGRDYLKEIADACHRSGLKLGFYFSQRDWVHPDYEPVDPSAAHAVGDPPFFEMNPGETLRVTDKHKRYIAYMHNAVRELMTNYGTVDLIWWDAAYYYGMYFEEMWESDKIEREVRQLQPHILINNRSSLPGDYDTPEGYIGMFQNDRPWESCMPLGDAWAWTGTVKDFRTALKQLLGCVCGDGNLLLSIGAMPDGCFDPPEIERIEQIGQWLGTYGESVYGTRGGPWLPGEWGGSCHKENMVYIHILEYPDDGVLLLDDLPVDISAYECLTGEDIYIERENGKMAIHIDKRGLENADIVIKLTTAEGTDLSTAIHTI